MNIDGPKNNAARPTHPGHGTRVKTRKHVAANAISARRHVKKRPTSTIRHNRAAVYVANSESPV